MRPYIDMHCDTLLRSLSEGHNALYEGKGMLDISRMKEAGQLCQFFAIFFQPESEREQLAVNGMELPEDEVYFQRLKENLLQVVQEHSKDIAMAYSAADIQQNQQSGRMSAILTIEDGRLVQGSMDRLCRLKEEGVRAIALTWNYENCFGYPNSFEEAKRNLGLKPFGKEAVEVMNDLGILIDVSHLSDGGFYDVAELTRKPFVATHSNCRAISPHSRNLTDKMIHILADKGGVAGINFAPAFLYSDLDSTHTTVEALARHTWHLLQTGGEECVALGTDFDGIEGTFEIDSPLKMDLLFEELKRQGMTERQLDKFTRENVLRVLREQD